MTHVLDWFLAAFPIKNEQDKGGLERLRELV
jgi:hypothetical protein